MFTLTVALIKIGVKGKALKFIDNGKFIKTVPQTKLALANHSFSHHFIGYCNHRKRGQNDVVSADLKKKQF